MHAGGRTKHSYANSDILCTTGIVDPVERVHCKVRQASLHRTTIPASIPLRAHRYIYVLIPRFPGAVKITLATALRWFFQFAWCRVHPCTVGADQCAGSQSVCAVERPW